MFFVFLFFCDIKKKKREGARLVKNKIMKPLNHIMRVGTIFTY